MTKREKARLVLLCWQRKVEGGVSIAESPKYIADLAAFEQAVRDEEAEECARISS